MKSKTNLCHCSFCQRKAFATWHVATKRTFSRRNVCELHMKSFMARRKLRAASRTRAEALKELEAMR